MPKRGDDIDMGLSSMHLWVETVRKKDTGKDKTRKKDKSGAGKTPEKKEGATEAGEGRGAERGEAGEGRGERRSEEEGIRLQAVVDRYVSSNPSSFGLESIPVRGSAGRHLVDRETRGRERPPEPRRPPPTS